MNAPNPGGTPGYHRRSYEAEVYARVDQTIAAAGGPSWIGPDAGRVAGDYSIDQGRKLESRVEEHGGYRPGLDPSDHDYRSVPHEQLVSYVNDGVNPQEVDEQGMIANDLGNMLKELSSNFTQAAAKEESAWQGDAAEQAHGFFGSTADWADSSGEAAYLASNRFSQTSAGLVNAKNSMPEPAGRSVEQSMDVAKQQISSGNFMDGLNTMLDMKNQAQIQQQAHDQAAAVVSQRDQTFFGSGSTQPSFAAPPQLSQTAVPVQGMIDGGTKASSVSQPSIPPGGIGSPMSSAGVPGGGSPVTSPNLPVSGGVNSGAGPTGGYPGTGGYSNTPPWSRTPAAGLGPAALGSVGPVGGPGQSGDTTRGGSSRTSGFSSRSGGPGGSAAGRLTGSGSGVKGVAGEEGRPGGGKGTGAAQPGARGAAEALNRGGASAAGGKGAPGALGAGGAGSKKEEDKEHKRAGYLQEDDPNEYFGTDGLPKTTPPVIGG